VTLSIVAVVAVTATALGIGTWGVRLARTTSDLFVASRAVSPWWNAAAISGEYLSAASFLGIAGLHLKFGASALWLPVGFTAGYLALLLFVAAPLRRFGSYTIPDFAEARLRSPQIRLLAAGIVLLIGGFYLVPQLKGAGLTLGQIAGAPYWVGVAVVASIVALSVGLGGMRGITYVQAFQYWVKVFAIALPAILLLIHLGGLPAKAALFGRELPQAPAGGLAVTLDEPATLMFPQAITYTIDGRRETAAAGDERRVPAGELRLPAGAAVPVADGIEAQRGEDWSRPVAEGGRASPLLVYSLLVATFLGTMGLPHILVRFYTNPDGHAARRTTVRVLGLLGLFYLFPAVYGLLGRALTPELYVTGDTDSVVLRLPEAAWPGLGGEILAAIVAAGAFAAFMSTASGLLVSVAGTIAYDVWGRLRRPHTGPGADRRKRFRVAAVAGMLVPALVALGARDLDISVLVGWAFALAASTFCPLFLLGIWWERLTARGAAAGMVAGAVTATAAITVSLALEPDTGSAGGALLTQPAVATVPIAFAVMVGVSVVRRAAPLPVESTMLALHAPEGLGLEAAPAPRGSRRAPRRLSRPRSGAP
jgi:cation/acetate symporter